MLISFTRGPGINNFDLSLFKNIRFSESARFQFGIEAYNIFNHPQFDAVSGNINGATFGRVTSARDPCIMQMLFDRAKDPNELKNLANDPAYAKTVAEMKKLLGQIPK